MIDQAVDGHIHTRLCNHAHGEMEDYVHAAIARGLRQIFFLEHLEAGISYFESTWLTDDDFDYYFTEGRRLQKKYAGQLQIGLGVEVGYNPNRLPEIRSRLARHRWDRVGISYHFLEHNGRHLNMVSRKNVNIEALGILGVWKVVERYLSGLTEAVEKLDGDILCHCDAVLRHHPEGGLQEGHDTMLGKLLLAMARKKMTLEVNTSGFEIRNAPFPGPAILKKAVRLGIPLVAGSDAHRPEQVGRYFERLPGLAEQLALS